MMSWLAKQAEKSEFECRRIELSVIEKFSDAKLLDVGCGDGTVTLKIAKEIGTKNVSGIEIVQENIDKAIAIGIDAHQGDLNQRLPFENESFDVVIANHVIEHLSNTDMFIKEIKRVLKSEGYLIIATPNLATWLHIFFLIFGKQPTIAEVSDYALVGTWSPRAGNVGRTGPAHRRIFTLGALKGLLEYYGLEVEKTIGAGYFPLTGFSGRVMSRVDKWRATNIVIKARKIVAIK